jgi:hypothetical protein
MTPETIERDFREKVSRKVRLGAEGLNRFRVFTPFVFDDGDHLCIVLRAEGDRWALTDEGHTFMHLTYEMDEKSLLEGTRNKIVTSALAGFGVEDVEGELRLGVPDERFGDALFAFVQALLRVADVRFLSRERVKSTFWEDFVSLMSGAVPEGRRQFDFHDPQHDPDGKYGVDCRINGMPRPLFVYAIPADDKCRDATIALLQFERWNLPHQSLAIFEEQESINRKVLARFSDVCQKQFSSLGANRDRIVRYLRDAASLGNGGAQ